MKNRVFECIGCGNVWEAEPCATGGKHGYEIACPKCGSFKKIKIGPSKSDCCGRSAEV